MKTLPGGDPEKAKTVSNAFGNRAFSRKDGYVAIKVSPSPTFSCSSGHVS